MTAETVRLRNGAQGITRALVQTTMLAIERIGEQNPIALYELAEACRDQDHILFGNSGGILLAYNLVESVAPDGRARVHESVRDIVLSAAEGDGLDLTFRNPIAPGESA